MIAAPVSGPGLRRLSRALVASGIVGLALAIAATIAVVVAIGRLGSLDASVGDGAAQLDTVLERMATVLDDASSTAGSFGTTIDTSSAALGTAASDLRTIVPQLRAIEAEARAVNILGSQPLAPVAGLFGQIAAQLEDLDTQLDGVASSLRNNQAVLSANTTSLAELAKETRALAERLGADRLAKTIDDARWLAMALLAVVLAGAIFPAAAALAIGLWLQTELRRGRLRSLGTTPV